MKQSSHFEKVRQKNRMQCSPRLVCITAPIALFCFAAFDGLRMGKGDSVVTPNVLVSFKLVDKWTISPDTKLLRFALPHDQMTLSAPDLVPSGIHAFLKDTAETGGGEDMKKSYSPVSQPDSKGYFDLLVKAYPPRPGGGMGAHLCGMHPGEFMRMEVKPSRQIHGSSVIAGRWKKLGFVAGGTGIAPFVQIIRFLLAHPTDKTEISLLSINRHEHDILLRTELDALSQMHKDRFRVTYSLTQPNQSWHGPVGRGTVDLARIALPRVPSTDDECGSTMVMVCGTDGFVDMWSGGIDRVKDPVTGKKKKEQGELKGILRDTGFKACSVYKF